MQMANHKEVTAIIGEYTNAKGELKKRYIKIGAIIDTKNGPMLKLDTIPLEWNGYAYINEPFDSTKPKGQHAAEHHSDEDIPF